MTEPGAHLIALCQGEAELTRAAAVCAEAGLASGDRVLYVASDRSLPAVRTGLEASSAAAGPAIAAGQLVLRNFPDVQAGPGLPDLAAAAGEFRAAAVLARAEGFPGLRIAAEMGDVTRVLGSIGQALAWERITTALQREAGISSVCHYDQQQLDGENSGLLAAAHAGTAPLSVPQPLVSFHATPQGLRITGELDIANRERFVRTVSARLAAIPQLILDVGKLDFIDAGTLGELHYIAAGLPSDGCITLAGASRQLRRLARILGGWPHPRLKIEPAMP
jgi:anti-anti-sigma regulatory factor